MSNMILRAIRFAALSGLAFGAMAGISAAQPAAQPGETAPQEAPLPENRQQALELLFERLANEEDERNGERIAVQIRNIWSASGSDSMDLLLRRGRSAMEAEEYGQARAHLAALTRLAPDFAEGWNAYATLHYLEKDYWTAVSHIERALALEPRHFSAMSGLALILERVDRPDAAMKTWRRVEALYPGLGNAKKAIERLELEVDGRDL